MKKELQGLDEGPEVNIHLKSLRATPNKVQNSKTPGLDELHGFWFTKFTSIRDRLALPSSKYLEESNIPELMTMGKTTQI